MNLSDFDALSRNFANGLSRRVVLKTLAVASLYSFVGTFAKIREARGAQVCRAADIKACMDKADADLERQLDDCNEVPNRVLCREAAQRRHNDAIKACNPCPANTRCESDVCCPNDLATCAPPCSIKRTNEGLVLQYTVRSSVAGPALTLIATHVVPDPVLQNAAGRIKFNSPPESAHGKRTVLLGSQLLLGIDYGLSSTSTTIAVTYGSAFQGVKSSLCIIDHDVVSGNVDGRAVIPFARRSNPGPIKFTFADGKPPPAVSIDPQVLSGLEQILRQGSNAAHICRQTQSLTPGTFDNTRGSPACITCEDACSSTAQESLDVAAALSVACLFEAPACLAAAAAAIQVQYDGCRRGCEGPGAACCPISCQVGCCDNGHTCCGSEGACCQQGEVCAGSVQGVGICCPQNSGPLCGRACCQSGQLCVDQNQGICCPTGSGLCGSSCCPNDSLCIGNSICCGPKDRFKDCGDGQCCPAEAACINNSCCMPPSHVCNGQCCAPFDVCCNGACCGGNNLCIDNRICCPRDQVCGHICCPAGQRCANGACAVCPPATVPCSSPGPNGVVVSICCAPGANCCLGVCCTGQTGHECTGPGGACGTIH